MSSNPNEMLSCALDIAARASSEANFRSVISRGYYAAFTAAYQWHAALPVPGSIGMQARGKHETLVAQLMNPMLKDDEAGRRQVSVAIGKMLNSARMMRNKADYNIDLDITEADMRSSLGQCVRVVEQLR